MDKENVNLRLLLVDDEDDFRRATSAALTRRGFVVTEAAGGEEALAAVQRQRPDTVILDLKMPGMGGIETLQGIRKIDATLPVIILTGHGDFETAMAGIKLDIVDFLQKPVDMDRLARHVRRVLEQGAQGLLRERTVGVQPGQVRSALVYDRDEKFLGLIRFFDMLKLVLPAFLEESPYTTFFTGMFLAQCKVSGKRNIRELMDKLVYVNVHDPIMRAVHLMVRHHLINLAVMDEGELVGILRERDMVLEIANVMEFK